MAKPEGNGNPAVDALDALYLFDPSPTHTEFMLARAHAVEQYASVEVELAQLCAHLMGVTPDVSGVMFYRMNNARSRLSVIEKLLKKRHSTKYNLFWNSLHKQLNPIDEFRNRVVHSSVKKTVCSYPGTNGIPWTSLMPPNWTDTNEHTEEIFRDDLYRFILKCHFFMQLILWFRMSLEGVEKASTPTWLQIFLEPVAYPPPSTHPLFRNWKALGTPPKPSLPK